MGSWNYSEDKFFIPKVICLAVLCVLEIFALYKYSKWDEIKHRQIEELQTQINDNLKTISKINLDLQDQLKQKNNFQKELLEVSRISQDTANDLNMIAHQIIEKGVIDLSRWNYKIACKSICKCAYEMLQAISLSGTNFSVSYIQKETIEKEVWLEMPAYEGTLEDPDLKDVRTPLVQVANYFYAQQFQNSKPSIVVLEDQKAICEKFVYPKEGSAALHKYNQYIGIPVLCSKKKMIGLLQVVALKESKIADTKEELLQIAEDYFMPLATFSMLMSKIEKAASAIPL